MTEFSLDSKMDPTQTAPCDCTGTDKIIDDASLCAEDLPDAAELTFEEKLAALEHGRLRHPSNREVLYQGAPFALRTSSSKAEDYIASIPQFEMSTQNQFYAAGFSLVRAYGLEMIRRIERGNRVLPEQKEGLSEDEVDDLVALTPSRRRKWAITLEVQPPISPSC